MLLYILFLPPEDRAVLLGEDNRTFTSSSNGTTISGFNKYLLEENIGRLEYLRFDYKEHQVPSFRVYSQKEAAILKSVSSVFLKNTFGEKKFFNISFNIINRLTTDVKLSFNVEEAIGRLEIYLNGREIFNGGLSKGTPEPIELSREFLEDENILSFKVSSPGFAFWRLNRYSLKNLLLTGDVLDISNSKSTQFFYLSEIEKNNLEEIKLKFYPNCEQNSVGPLIIYFNAQEAFSGVADCGVYNTLFLDRNEAFVDKNELEFVATKGSYFLDRVSIVSNLEGLINPVYYFDLEDKLFVDNDLNESFNISMEIRFVNDDYKKLEYNINGRTRSLQTNDLAYSFLLDNYVFSGINSLELIPKSIVDIALLKIVLNEE
jgi:hypothetical protein